MSKARDDWCDHPKAHRTAPRLGVKNWRGRLIERPKGGTETKLHAVRESQGRLLNLFAPAGQVCDDTGAGVAGQFAKGGLAA